MPKFSAPPDDPPDGPPRGRAGRESGGVPEHDEPTIAERTILRADWLLTMDGPPGRAPGGAGAVEDGALVIAGGDIVDLGPAGDVLARHRGLPEERLDGHVLLPGLVNAHSHLAMAMFRGVADDRDLDGFLSTVLPLEAALLDHTSVRTATTAALVESLRAGVTTVLDMYFFADAALDAAADCGARLLTGPVLLDEGGPEPMAWPERMSRAAEWLQRHPPRRGWRPVVGPHATYTVSPEHLREVAELAGPAGAVVHVHAAETTGETEAVLARHGRRPVGVLEAAGLLRPRTVLAHGVHLLAEEVDLLAGMGAAVAHCPASNLKLASGVAPVRSLVAAGATVALGTDGPASSNDLDVLGAARLAALLHKGAATEGPDAEAMAAADVLWLATRGGAAAVGLDGEVGVLRPGAVADLVAVDLRGPHTQPVFDPASTLLYAAGRSDVAHVWVGGRRVVRDGVVISVDAVAAAGGLRDLGDRVARTVRTDPPRP